LIFISASDVGGFLKKKAKVNREGLEVAEDEEEN